MKLINAHTHAVKHRVRGMADGSIESLLKDRLLLLAAGKDGKIAMGFVYAKSETGVSTELGPVDFLGAKVSDIKSNKEVLQGLLDGGMSVAALYGNPEMDILMEMVHVMNEHYGKLGQ